VIGLVRWNQQYGTGSMKIRNQHVLVTGADGFIGSHLTEMLVLRGARVRALSYYNSFNSWGWLDDMDCRSEIEVVSGDIRDAFFCRSLTQDIDTIFHLAALIAIPYSYQAPQSYFETNVNGTLNICQAALDNDCQRFLQTSTSEVYGTARYVPIDEKHPLQAQSPYSASKIGADAVAMSFFHSFDLPLTVARPFNTFGPRQSARAVIPTIITQISNGRERIDLGDTRPTRDFTYVLDTCHALIALAESDQAVGEIVNIGSNHEISIHDLAKKIAGMMGRPITLNTTSERLRPKNSEVFRLWCDNTKYKRLTGKTMTYSFREALEQTVTWFTKTDHLNHYKAEIYNV
jgi:NAD dependent epimerase/dehydratase